MIETLVAIMIFAIVAAGGATVLTGAVTEHGLTRQRTLAEQLATQEMETIRQLPYASVGLTSGNPGGTLAASSSIALTGLHGTLTRQVRWVDDAAAGTPYVTHADYKRVTITVTRSDGKVLTTQTSYLSPFDAASYGGPNVGSLKVTVLDMAQNAVVPNVSVAISNGPSGSATDTTDATGSVIFPALKPGNGSSCYEIAVTPPTGYAVYYKDKPSSCGSSAADADVTAAATATETIRIYKPADVTFNVTGWGAPVTASTTVTLSTTLPGNTTATSFTYTVTNGTGTFAADLNGSPTAKLPPSSAYTVAASFKSGTTTVTAPQQTGVQIPVLTGDPGQAYPDVSAATINIVYPPDTTVTVYLKTKSGSRQTCTLEPNQTVTVTGGPKSLTGVQATTGASGTATFDLVPGAGYTFATAGSAGSGSLTNQTVKAIPNTTAITITILGSGASGTCP